MATAGESKSGICAWDARVVQGGFGRRYKVPDQESAKKAILNSTGEANHVEVEAALSGRACADVGFRPWCDCSCSATCDSEADSSEYEIPCW